MRPRLARHLVAVAILATTLTASAPAQQPQPARGIATRSPDPRGESRPAAPTIVEITRSQGFDWASAAIGAAAAISLTVISLTAVAALTRRSDTNL